MKHVLLIKDGEPSLDSQFSSDFNKELSDDSLLVINKIAEQAAKLSYKPELIYCSPSTVSLQAARIFSRKLNLRSSSTLINRRLMNRDFNLQKDLLNKLEKSIESVALLLPIGLFENIVSQIGSSMNSQHLGSDAILFSTGISQWSLLLDLPLNLEKLWFLSEETH